MGRGVMGLSRRSLLWGVACLVARRAVAQTATGDFQILRAMRAKAPLMGEGIPATAVWTFDKPVVSARQGEELRLRVFNDLDFEIWLHFFGVRGPSELMTFNVPAGWHFDCVFVPPDAGTFWLGPMADISRLRDMGLYAMVAVAEAEALSALEDVPLVLDDWMLDDVGRIVEGFGDVATMVGEGRLGNWFTVNGRYRPHIALAADKTSRLRILNAANTRSFDLLFKGGDPLLVALDGQPVMATRLGASALVLAPGQRADVLLAPDASTTMALDLYEDISELCYLDAGKAAVVPDLAATFALPANPIPVGFDSATARQTPLVIEGGLKGGLKQALYGGQMADLRTLLGHGMGWAFNGAAGPGGAPLLVAKTGEALVIAVDNRTAFAQPLHIHGHVWREVTAEGGTPWRDTAVVGPHGQLKLGFIASNPGSWAIQSLIAERADGGLLGGFTVS
jgi:FtsP/CotA-like multicopper oxidase with cupredoxin domain